MANGRFAQSRVGVLGTGEVERRLAAGFSSRGHEVMIGSCDPGKHELREWLSGDGAGVKAGTFEQTAAHGALLALAVLGNAAEEVIADARAENFSGKVIIDAMNPLDFSGGFPPKLSVSGEDPLDERVQRALPDAQGGQGVQHDRQPLLRGPKLLRGQADDADRGKRRGRQTHRPRCAG